VIYVFEQMKERGLPIRQFQVEQTSPNKLVVRVVAQDAFDATAEREIVSLLQKHLQTEFEIEIQRVREIAREKSGKLRLVKSRVTNRDPVSIVGAA
jgi:phenylacetate-coenzyme A ligase PaaK-like adenylate-forming protein